MEKIQFFLLFQQESVSAGGEDVYESFNIVMRRKPKENNFKAVLETIREVKLG
jgi:intron-binding protein aquarius